MISDQDLARRASRAEFVTRLFIVLLAFLLAAAVVTIVQIRTTQLEGTPTGRKLVASADRILECTEPKPAKDGKETCYQRSQRQTAEIVGQIGAGQILAVVCALDVPDGTPTDAALEQVTKCVSKRLRESSP